MNRIDSKVVLLALVTICSPAFADDGAASSITSNVGFTSDYTFRGISQNYRSPALQGGFDYAGTGGVYMGTWASTISGNQYTNASMEWDVYGGLGGKITDDLSYSAGINYALYPNGKTAPTSANTKNWDTAEVNAGLTYMGFNLKYTYALTNWYGISGAAGGGFEPMMIVNDAATTISTADNAASNPDSKGSNYIEANYTYSFLGDHALLVHAGRQTIQNFSALSYTDYKLGLTKQLGSFAVGVAYTTTTASDNQLYHVIANGDNKNLRGNIWALSVNRTF